MEGWSGRMGGGRQGWMDVWMHVPRSLGSQFAITRLPDSGTFPTRKAFGPFDFPGLAKSDAERSVKIDPRPLST